MVVIVCEDLLGKVMFVMSIMLDYKVYGDNDFMYNMSFIFVWYLFGLVFEWFKE